MKLTNLSLAILVAFGVAACGGSDNNDNQTTDGGTPPGSGNAGNTGTGNETSGLIPTRKAPAMKVADDLKKLVDTRKSQYINRGIADRALGYPKSPYTYDSASGTDPENLKLKSTYNFSQEGDLIIPSGNGKTAVGGYPLKAVGAIYVGDKPQEETNNAYAKAPDGKYYRVKASGITSKDEYTKDTKFESIDSKKTLTDVPQSKVVFIANAKGDVIDLGKKTADYILSSVDKQKQVVLDSITLLGKTYPADTLGQNIDFSKMPLSLDKNIQVQDITGDYSVINTKDTATNDDDKVIKRKATLGQIKAYNLPYSLALVTTNAKGDSPKNIFNLQGVSRTNGVDGSFQLYGLLTNSLPKEGRAIYTGKSFSANVVGDITLSADFATDRTGIEGSVYNRHDNDGKVLPNLTLVRTQVTSPVIHDVNGYGSVLGDPGYVNQWSVGFYGPEAEEVAGELIKVTEIPVVTTGSSTPTSSTYERETKEVYGAQRGALTNQSNDSSVH